MTNYFVGDDGINITINDDLFDLVWNKLGNDVPTKDSEKEKKLRRRRIKFLMIG